MGLFQGQPAVIAGAQAIVVENLLDGDRRDAASFEPVAAVSRVFEGQLLEALDGLGRCGLGMALVDRRQVLEAFEAVRLEASLPFVEAGTVKTSSAFS